MRSLHERRVARRAGWQRGAVLLSLLLCPAVHASDDAASAAHDAALRALAERVEARPGNAALARAVAELAPELGRDPPAAAARLREALEARSLGPLRVPGLFYRSHPDTGADLSLLPRALGVPVPLVETDEVGSVESNAARVAAAIREHARGGRRLLLVSVSKGSAEVRLALETDPSLADSVAGWLDLVGVLEGTPLTDPGVPWQDSVHELLPDVTARSLSHAVRSRSIAPARFPQALPVVHVAAFPESADLTDDARHGFQRLRSLGPNDGYVLLDALLRAPGRVLVVRGADHYLRVEAIADRIAAVLLILLEAVPPADGGA